MVLFFKVEVIIDLNFFIQMDIKWLVENVKFGVNILFDVEIMIGMEWEFLIEKRILVIWIYKID